jgi:hypothetical protein
MVSTGFWYLLAAIANNLSADCGAVNTKSTGYVGLGSKLIQQRRYDDPILWLNMFVGHRKTSF